jgi:hypothetical protein
MKKLLFLPALFFICAIVNSQAPVSFNYQVVVRDASFNPLVTQPVSFRITILKTSEGGTQSYRELHSATTNEIGHVNLSIGNGTSKEGDMTAIDWAADKYYLKVEVDPAGGVSYTLMGTTQLLSVPYALHAKTAASFTETDPQVGANTTNYLSKWNGTALVKSSVFDVGMIGIGTNEPLAFLDLSIPVEFRDPGLSINMPDFETQTRNNNALTVSSMWRARDILKTDIFRLYDEGATPAAELYNADDESFTSIRPGGTMLRTGPEGSGLFMTLSGERGLNHGSSVSGFNLKINSDMPLQFRTYSGAWTDKVRIANTGDAYFSGNLDVGGVITGDFEIDEIHVSKITGLLGEGFTAVFPDVVNNLASLEIPGVLTFNEKVVVVSGPGSETERISIPISVDPLRYRENPGFTMEFPIIFETANVTDINNLKIWFDNASPAQEDAALIIRDLGGSETSRWTLTDYLPDGYEPGTDGRTRFSIIPSGIPDNILKCEFFGIFGDLTSYEPATDKRVQITGVDLGTNCCPAVEVDNVARTITLTFNYWEGYRVYDWIKAIASGTGSPCDVSIIETTNGIDELSRKNYFESIPVKYEQFYGFGQDMKLKARVVIAFGFWEDA